MVEEGREHGVLGTNEMSPRKPKCKDCERLRKVARQILTDWAALKPHQISEPDPPLPPGSETWEAPIMENWALPTSSPVRRQWHAKWRKELGLRRP